MNYLFRHKFITVQILVLAFILTNFQIPASAANKVGSIFMKPGATSLSGKTSVKCVKLGKKYVWSKIPNNSKKDSNSSKPTNTLNPEQIVFTPWSTTVSKDILISQAIANYQTWVSQNQGELSNSIVYQDEKVDLSHRSMIVSGSQRSQNIFAKLLNRPYKLFIAKDDKWIKDKLVEINMPAPPGDTICGVTSAPNSYCAGSDHAFFIIRSDNSLQSLQKSDYQTPGHEYFHTVQREIGGSNYSIYPSWFYEGSANFIGTVISNDLKYFTYTQTRDEEVSKPWTNRSVSLEEFKVNDSSKGLNNWLSPYGIGQVATEFIIASVGMDSFINIFKYTKELNNFSLGFSKATSVELAQFYKLFDQGRVLWGIQSVAGN